MNEIVIGHILLGLFGFTLGLILGSREGYHRGVRAGIAKISDSDLRNDSDTLVVVDDE